MVDIDLKSRTPIHKQLYDFFRWQILDGSYKENDELPSVRELAISLAVNPNTIQKAYMELRREGYVFSVPGKGNYVNKIPKKSKDEEISRLKNKITKISFKLETLGVKKEEVMGIIEDVYKEKSYD